MKLLIDTNVILDVLENRGEEAESSSIVWKLCETEVADGYVSMLSFANMVYILRKQLDPEGIDKIFNALTLIFKFLDLTESDLCKAAQMKWDDFEDAIQSTAAEKAHADFIITRNVKDFKNSRIPAFLPSEFIKNEIK